MNMKDKATESASETIPDRPGAPRLTPEEIVRETARRSARKPSSRHPQPDPDDALADKRGEG